MRKLIVALSLTGLFLIGCTNSIEITNEDVEVEETTLMHEVSMALTEVFIVWAINELNEHSDVEQISSSSSGMIEILVE